jgi:hypothetical protein
MEGEPGTLGVGLSAGLERDPAVPSHNLFPPPANTTPLLMATPLCVCVSTWPRPLVSTGSQTMPEKRNELVLPVLDNTEVQFYPVNYS